jgi:predicted secreted protein
MSGLQRSRHWGTWGLGLGWLYLAACQGQAPQPSPPPPQVEIAKPAPAASENSHPTTQPTEAPADLPEEIILTEEHAGETLVVRSGQRLEIRLRGNLMTGYDWRVDKVTPELPPPKQEYQPPQGPEDGSQGTKRIWWDTEGLRGTFQVHLIYQRRVATKPPLKTYDVTLRIER